MLRVEPRLFSAGPGIRIEGQPGCNGSSVVALLTDHDGACRAGMREKGNAIWVRPSCRSACGQTLRSAHGPPQNGCELQ